MMNHDSFTILCQWYVARHQLRVDEKLNWDKTALYHALQINDDSAKPVLPSLLLNIGKCYEDPNDLSNAHLVYTHQGTDK